MAIFKKEITGLYDADRYYTVKAFPLTPNGKVDRDALVSKAKSPGPFEKADTLPRNDLEEQLLRIWQNLLNVERIGVESDFFEMGGHSLLAMRMISEIKRKTGMDIALASVFNFPSISQLARAMALQEEAIQTGSLVPVQVLGSKHPLCIIHGSEKITSHFDQEQPFYYLYGLYGRGALPQNNIHIEDIASEYIEQIKTIQPNGPYCLCGFSVGGLIAIEMAHQLTKQADRVALLFLADGTIPKNIYRLIDNASAFERKRRNLSQFLSMFRQDGKDAMRFIYTKTHRYSKTKIHIAQIYLKNMLSRVLLKAGFNLSDELRQIYVNALYKNAARHFEAPQFSGRAIVCQTHWKNVNPAWSDIFTGQLDVHLFEGEHLDLITDSQRIASWTALLKTELGKANNNARGLETGGD